MNELISHNRLRIIEEPVRDRVGSMLPMLH